MKQTIAHKSSSRQGANGLSYFLALVLQRLVFLAATPPCVFTVDHQIGQYRTMTTHNALLPFFKRKIFRETIIISIYFFPMLYFSGMPYKYERGSKSLTTMQEKRHLIIRKKGKGKRWSTKKVGEHKTWEIGMSIVTYFQVLTPCLPTAV